MNKKEISEILEEIATLLELQGENPFRVRAYRNGARALLAIEEDLGEIIQKGKLVEYQGIGEHLSEKIIELFQTGKLPYYENLKSKTPSGLLELLQVQGLGPKKIKLLNQKLKISSLEDLKKAAQSGKIAKLKGFGAKTEQNILLALENKEAYGKRFLWWDAWQIGNSILNELKNIKGVKRAEICGSLRRKLETIGDLDFLVGSKDATPVIEHFISLADQVIAKGETKCSIRLKSGMQADLRVVPENQFVYALIYFTGSKEHNIKIRNLSLKKGWSLSEYGFKSEKKNIVTPKIQNEEAFYKALDLHYIPPELRENLGEIEAAAEGPLPILIEESDIRGTFHNHTTASDGRSTLKEMIETAEKLGWEYIGISDHSKSSFQANGLSAERLLEQIETVRKINQSKKHKIYVFSGIECDILPNGVLDFPNEVLKPLDFVIASVHSSLTQDEKTMTKRIIKALENPLVTMLGHPTGRLLLKRGPYAVNMDKVIDAAIANDKIIEINGSPSRMDMDWRLWHRAIKKGLRCCINCDAHHINQLEFFRSGINVARKGWLKKNDAINTLSLKEIKKLL